MKKKLTYEGITFDAEWAASKTLEEFKEHEKHHGLTADQLKEAHGLCKKLVEPEEKKK